MLMYVGCIGKRLREAKKSDESARNVGQRSETIPDNQIALYHNDRESLIESATPCDWFNSLDSLHLRPEIPPVPASQSTAISTTGSQQTLTISYDIPHEQTVFSALYLNGEILGLICGMYPRMSPPGSATTPPALYPTPTQLYTVHNTGYDRFPFPRMRDNAIIHRELIDDDEFFRDLFTKPSFTIKPGTAPWDPSGWVMEKEFAEKWAFLFY